MPRPDENKEAVTGTASTEPGKTEGDMATDTETKPGDTSAETKKTETKTGEGKVEVHGIPKWRFDEINNERKEALKELGAVKGKITELEKAIQSATSARTPKKFDDPQEQAFHDKYISDLENQVLDLKSGLKTVLEEITQTKKVLEEGRITDAKVKVKSELAELKKRFPEMNEKEVLVDYSESEDETLEELAEKSHKEMTAKIQKGIDYRQGKEKNADDNPPPMPKGGSPAAGIEKMPKGLNFHEQMKWSERQAIKDLAGAK